MKSLSITIIGTSLREQSQSQKMAKWLLDWFEERSVRTWYCNAASFEPYFCLGDEEGDLSPYPPQILELYEKLLCSDGVIIATPIYLYSVSGVAKNLIDVIGDALAWRAVALVSAAGTLRSHLAIADFAKSLQFEYHTLFFPQTVQFTRETLWTSEDVERISSFAGNFLDFTVATAPFSRKRKEGDGTAQ